MTALALILIAPPATALVGLAGALASAVRYSGPPRVAGPRRRRGAGPRARRPRLADA